MIRLRTVILWLVFQKKDLTCDNPDPEKSELL